MHFNTQFIILLTFFEIYLTFHCKDCFNKHIYKFDDVGNTGYSSLLKIKVFENKGHDVIICVHDVTSKILSRDYNHFYKRNYDNLDFIRIWPEKQIF